LILHGYTLKYYLSDSSTFQYRGTMFQQEWCQYLFVNTPSREIYRKILIFWEISKVRNWPRRRAVAQFRMCVGHDCLGAHLHSIGIRPDPYCMLCSLHEPMDRNHLGQCTAIINKTECGRYWEARTINDGKLTLFSNHYYFVTTP